MPTARAGLSLCVWNDTIYAIGGHDWSGPNESDTVYDILETYHPEINFWWDPCQYPDTGVDGVWACRIADTIYVFGGRSGSRIDYNICELNQVYFPDSNSWDTRAPMDIARYQHVGAMVVRANTPRIYAMGGSLGEEATMPGLYENEEYTPGTGGRKTGKFSHELSSIQLFHTYPNPSNSVVTRSYCLAKPERVIIRIYDVMGQRVATLLNERQPGGEHTVTWNIEGVNVGIYFVRFKTDGSTLTRKVIIMR